MKYFSTARNILFLSIILISSELVAKILSGNTGQCKMHFDSVNDNIISVWQSLDDSGKTGILAGKSLFTSPGSFTPIDLTISGITQNSRPQLTTNANGDVVAVWEYVDLNNNYQVAAAVLPSGSSTWSTTTQLSTTLGEFAGFGDESVSIDEAGKVFVIWTSSDGSITRVRGATYDINALTPTWITGLNISQN
jgi:hypothetical protein